MGICMWKCSAHADQQRKLDALELELQVIVSHPTGVLGSTLDLQKSSQGTVLLNHLLRPKLTSKVWFFILFYSQKKHLISREPKMP